MSVLQFPNQLYLNAFKAGELAKLGSFKASRSMELAYVLLTILKTGPWDGSERFRLKLYPTGAFDTPLFASEWRDLDVIDAPEPDHWYGLVRLDFTPSVPVNPELTYHAAVETDGYADSGSFYFGAKLDWPDAVYSDPIATRRVAQMRLIGYTRTTDDEDDPMAIRRLEIAEGVEVTAPVQLQTAASIDFSWSALATETTVDVSAYVADARLAGWVLKAPSGRDFEQIMAEIDTPSATQVRIAVGEALDAGTYRLIGVY